MKKKLVLIDTDPGIDDYYAILLARYNEGIDIQAITVASGNVGIENTLTNALGIKEYLEIDCPVYRGSEKPMVITLKQADDVHGKGGLGRYEFKDLTYTEEKDYAWDAIYKHAVDCKGELEILSLAPPTNIALALLKYPELKTLIKRIVIMGGSTEGGNSAPYSEFNFWCDPHASKILLESGIMMELYGLNATWQGKLTYEEITSIRHPKEEVNKLMDEIILFYKIRMERTGEGELFHMPDAVAAAALIDPTVARLEDVYMDCIYDEGMLQGMTVVHDCEITGNKANVKLATVLDSRKFISMMQHITEEAKQ